MCKWRDVEIRNVQEKIEEVGVQRSASGGDDLSEKD